jgi:crotonobetainyl-CoA:carnitine CoA-transferase CaiB-like acyl-CoA transferase
VLIENYRPGTLERMGLGPETLQARNGKLVIVRVSGWGQTGPYAQKPGFGTLVEGMSGYAAKTGFPIASRCCRRPRWPTWWPDSTAPTPR